MKPSIQIHIDSSVNAIERELTYILLELFKPFNESLSFFNEPLENSLTIAAHQGDLITNEYNFVHIKQLSFDNDFTANGFLKLENGNPDYLATAFYLLSCAQELDDSRKDKFGRFPYQESYQKYFSNAEKNMVQFCFDEILKSINKLSSLKKQTFKSRIFLSHDVDTVYGALMQDGFYAVKKLNIPGIFNIMFSNLLIKPQWLNMDKIMKIETEYDFKSTFYWLVNKGLSKEGIKNADYIYNSPKVQSQVELVTKNGWENGIHKSISDESFEEEIVKLKFKPKGNRYHFLKFKPHHDFAKINHAGIKLDTSLGFAEELGFRNSYGLPYKPYDFKNKMAFNFVECPLHIMDTTLHSYQKLSANEAYNKIISFTEKNAENTILSVLWHNNYFTPYKYESYFVLYKKLLAYFYESKFACITQSQIIEKYS
jgi:hypothetical protein